MSEFTTINDECLGIFVAEMRVNPRLTQVNECDACAVGRIPHCCITGARGVAFQLDTPELLTIVCSAFFFFSSFFYFLGPPGGCPCHRSDDS